MIICFLTVNFEAIAINFAIRRVFVFRWFVESTAPISFCKTASAAVAAASVAATALAVVTVAAAAAASAVVASSAAESAEVQ